MTEAVVFDLEACWSTPKRLATKKELVIPIGSLMPRDG
jgi:hypothetical protein